MKSKTLRYERSGNFLSRHIIRILIGLFLVAIAVVFLHQIRLYRSVRVSSALNEARRHIEVLESFRTLYTAKVVSAARAYGMPVAHDYQNYEHGAIPLPATLSMELGEELNRQGKGDFRLYSPYPFPWREATGGLTDSFAKDAWQALNEDPDNPFYRIEQREGQDVMRYAIADRMRESCVECHNTHPDTPRRDWKVGDVRGLLDVTTPIRVAAADVKWALWESSLIVIGLGGIAFFALSITIKYFNKTSVRLNDQIGTLKQYSEKLERCNKDLDDFAHIASHDLRAPLRAIHHLADWIEEDTKKQLSSESTEHLSKLKNRIKRMDNMLTDLLTYFRTGRDQSTTEQVDARDLTQGIIDMLDTPKTFIVSVPEDNVSLNTFKTPLELCLRNLISNAIKHHDRLDGRVSIMASEQDDYVEFTVNDDGPGIDPKHHDRIFQMFKTLQSRAKGEGSGIGLATIRKTVETYSGTISVQSTLGEGTTFRLRWPRYLSN